MLRQVLPAVLIIASQVPEVARGVARNDLHFTGAAAAIDIHSLPPPQFFVMWIPGRLYWPHFYSSSIQDVSKCHITFNLMMLQLFIFIFSASSGGLRNSRFLFSRFAQKWKFLIVCVRVCHFLIWHRQRPREKREAPVVHCTSSGALVNRTWTFPFWKSYSRHLLECNWCESAFCIHLFLSFVIALFHQCYHVVMDYVWIFRTNKLVCFFLNRPLNVLFTHAKKRKKNRLETSHRDGIRSSKRKPASVVKPVAPNLSLDGEGIINSGTLDSSCTKTMRQSSSLSLGFV